MTDVKKLQAILALSKQVRKASLKFWLTTVLKDLIKNVEYFFVSVVVIKIILDGLQNNIETHEIVTWIAVAAITEIAKELFFSYYNNCVYITESAKIEEYFTERVMDKSGIVDIDCYDDKEYYDNYIMATKDIDKKSIKMIEDIGVLIGTVALIALTSTFVIMIDPMLLIFVTVPVIGDAILRIKISNAEYVKKEELLKITRKQDYINKVSNDISYAEEVRLFSLKDFWDGRFILNMQEEEVICKRHFPKLLRLFLLSDSLYEPKNLLIILYLVYKVLVLKSISPGDFIAVQAALSGFGGNLGKITQRTTVFNEHALYASRYIAFIEKQNSILDGMCSLGSINSIEFCDVSFRYTPDGPDVLRGISFKLSSGDKIALVGKNGQGKSTVVKLMLRLYDATDGKILINDRPISEYKIDDLRREISYLSQQFHCYKLSILDNLMTDTYTECQGVSRMLGLSETIDSLPCKESTFIGKDMYAKGVELSRGQQQKIATVRAVNKGGSLLILDEPTAALDPLSERKLLDALGSSSVGDMSVTISHNMSLAKKATKIIVLEEGKIKEMGTHDYLMSQRGIYHNMYISQTTATLEGKEMREA